jgi:hypothetical protein|tara:strand:- start:176 stop:1117 length:942 start_codon:yes stop_codon:yes gene_type:complete
MSSSIRDKRRKRSKITSNDELYEQTNEVFDAPEETPEYVEEIQIKTVDRKRFRPLMGEEYQYTQLAEKYSERNVAQQLGNYRQAMEFLAHVSLPKNNDNDKIVSRLKTMIYSYPNVDVSSFVNKHHALTYSWMIDAMVRVYGEKYLGTAYILGGGIGVLGAMLLDTQLRLENIRSLDINGTCKFLADEMMQPEVLDNWTFKASTQDLFDVNYEENTLEIVLPDGRISTAFKEIPGLVINTNISCLEKQDDWYTMIPDTRKVVLMGEGGVEDANTVRGFSSSQSFNEMFPMTFVQYTGVTTVEGKQYFLKIGIK